MIELRGIKKVFNAGTVNEKIAINSVDLTIEEGDFITVIGSNGAGKSTLLSILAGFLSPDSGCIMFGGDDITKVPEYKRAKYIGVVFQDPLSGTAKSLSIEENMAIASKRGTKRWFRKGVTSAKRAHFKERLKELGLGLEDRLNTNAGLLSGGQRQSLTLLMAAMAEPQILLLDEHTAALDPRTAGLVMGLTDKIIKDTGLTAMMVTHNMKQALEYGNRIIMMHEGEIVLDIKGADKEGLTIPDLLGMFEKVRGEGLADDKLLLSK
ncbi:ABC transporter ATP-binding protein [Deferribacteres bacterium DY0037]